jgi:hypothetical protein
LFYVGEYQLALDELVEANYLVEATYMALALRELGLISTRDWLLRTLRGEGSYDK